MKRNTSWVYLAVLLSPWIALAQTNVRSPAPPLPVKIQSAPGHGSRLGINLAGVVDWSTELPFSDVFHQARAWISQKEGTPWGHGPALSLDQNGWIKKLDPNCSAQSPVFSLPAAHMPKGSWTLLYEGEGKVELWPPNTNKILSEEPGKITFDSTPDSAGTCTLFLTINSTNPKNYIRKIHVLWPGTEATWQANPFRDDFLNRWKNFNTIRFMDWMDTNGSAIKEWADRPKIDDAVWSTKGVPLEVIIDLCNRAMVNPWLCVPHLAPDDYVHHFARYVKEHLRPGLKAHIELSNEVWNGMFPQSQWAQQKAKELHLGAPERPWEGGAMYHVRRSLEVFKIFEQVFGGTDRLVRVIAWQAATTEDWTDGLVLGQPGVEGHVDVLAIAPYMTFCVPPQTDKDQIGADQVSTWSLDQLFDHLNKVVLPQSITWMQNQKKFADKRGVKLMTYESGQHLVGIAGGENNEAMTTLFMNANRDPRMGALYTKYMDAWKNTGGDTMCLFSSVGTWGKWGSWGLLEYYDQTAADEPKFKAVTDWNSLNRR
jgi:hypothetical protein